MKIGNFDLDKQGVYIIAELSANHNGSLDIAKQTIAAAKAAGANAIKLQTYRADTITLNCQREDFIVRGGTLWDGKSLHELYEWAHTPWEWHEELFNTAKTLDIAMFSSPFDLSAIDFLKAFDPPAYKIASFEITDIALIRYAAQQGKPLIISCGVGTYDEIQAAVSICQQEGVEPILLKCTSAYPAPLSEAHLRSIPAMKQAFACEVGFSDHTLGIVAPISAVSLGARVIEKHFILDKTIGGPDAEFSLDPEEFASLVQNVRECEKLLGSIKFNDEFTSARRFARSLYVKLPIAKGDIFSLENICSVRPGYGLHPKYLSDIIGKQAPRNFKVGDRLELEGYAATYAY